MALADALDDMRRYAARGRVGDGEPAAPYLRLDVTGRITRGEVAVVSWWATNAQESKIIIMSPGAPPVELRVPPRGSRPLPDLPIGRHTILLRARSARRRGDGIFEEAALVEVMHPRPVIEVIAPRRIVLGNVLQLSWRIRDAQRAEIITTAGPRPAELQDIHEVRPLECGTVHLQLKAIGPGGETVHRLSVEVVAPPVVIDVPVQVLAEPGEDIVIRYSTSGAATLMLSAPNRDEPARPIPSTGRIEFDAVTEPERLVFNAIGHDGRRRSRTICVNLMAMTETPINDFLEILNGR